MCIRRDVIHGKTKGSSKKLLEQTNRFRKDADHKVNINNKKTSFKYANEILTQRN